ncbi:cullin 4, partial [Geosmithia morbida]
MQPASSDAQGPSPSRRRSRYTSSPVPSSGGSGINKRAKFSTTEAAAAEASSRRKKSMPPDTVDMSQMSSLPSSLPSSSPSVFQPYSGARRLVIKNLRTSASADRDAQVQQHYERTHRDLRDALDAVFSSCKPAVPLERLYRGVEDLCRRGDADKVYRTLRESMDTHVRTVILPRIERSARTSTMETASRLLSEWQTWNTQMILVRSTFSYLDRTYLLREKLPSINDLTISYFKKMAFPAQGPAYAHSTGKKTVTAMCELIQSDRTGEGFDAALLKGCLRMLYVLNVYVKYFEPVFLELSEPFFRDFVDSHATSSLKAYIQACESLLTKEHYRCLEFAVESATERQLMDTAHAITINDYTGKLLDADSMAKLLASKDVDSMKGLYQLLCLSGIQKQLRQPWTDYIRGAVSQVIGDKERGDEMVVRLLDLRRSLDLMIRDAFSQDDELLYSMREAFGSMMNDRKVAGCWDIGTSKIGEMIAKHIDMLLRGGLKALPTSLLSDVKDRAAAEKEGQASTADEDAELNRQLDQALELFRFIEGKDTFEAFYKKHLARRLLLSRSASQDAERSMLAKLRGECGANFTHNLEQMFKDQELTRDEMEAYEEWCRGGGPDRKPLVDLHVMVLSAAAWPSYPDVQLSLPDEVATETERFDAFYKNKHTGRILSWKHSLAQCVLKAKFPKGARELVVSAYQAAVLLLFNSVPNDGALGYDQISKSTGLRGGDLDRTLQSLACAKVRVLSKYPKGREVGESDTFTFNRAFYEAKYRIKINQIQQKETREENKATHERIAQDRRFETQAAIVRIMKSRKTMTHPDLQAEVINMTKKRGSVEPAAIKKEIE